MTRTFHVEVTMRKWVEVTVGASDFDDEDELRDFVECDALENFNSSDRTFDDDYEIETVKEVTEAA